MGDPVPADPVSEAAPGPAGRAPPFPWSDEKDAWVRKQHADYIAMVIAHGGGMGINAAKRAAKEATLLLLTLPEEDGGLGCSWNQLASRLRRLNLSLNPTAQGKCVMHHISPDDHTTSVECMYMSLPLR
eukprot:49775-Eustigmatos_ZCMA.PRE.1